MCFAADVAYGNPTAPTVINGQVTFARTNGVLSIANSPGSIINWQRFSIGAGETTRFIQQSAASAVLNRVVGRDPSSILGSLQSNGRVFLINPNGILFGAGAQVDVAGLVASTLNMSDADFLGGRLRFTDGLGKSVVNEGNINTGTGGSVYLIGSGVTNNGIIRSPQGEVILAAGNSVELVSPGTPNLRVEITATDNEARNLGQIISEAGRIGIYAGLINHSGAIRADSAQLTADGRIVLKATKNTTLEAGSVTTANGPKGGSITIQSGDTTLVSGTVEATASEAKGGRIELLGEHVGLINAAEVNASGKAGGGTVLVGGDYQGKNPDVQNAARTYVGPDTAIRADAIDAGDGGKVIVWADDTTQFYGSISARGGATSGNGGFVETSGKGWLDFSGLVDTRAPMGASGTLLLDPTNIYIALNQANATGAGMIGTDNSANTGPTPFAASGAVQDSLLTTGTLNTALGSSNVVVTTTNASGTGVGDITVVNPITWASANTLTLTAANNIAINAGITTGAAGSALILNASGNVTQSAVIGGAGGLTQSGAGTVTLSQANTYTGLTTVSAGTLVAANNTALGTTAGSTTIASGATLNINGVAIGAEALNVQGTGVGGNGAITGTGTASLSGGITLAGNTTIGGAGTVTLSGVIADGGGNNFSLTKTGAGTLVLTGANTYGNGTNVNQGVLNLRNAGAAGNAGTVTVANGAAVEVQGGITVARLLTLNGTGIAGGGALRNISGTNTWSGAITLGSASRINSDAGTLTLSGAGNITGAGQRLTVGGAGNTTISKVIATTTGTLTKDGAGTLTLSGANTYTGLTTVSAGTLTLGANNVLANGTSVVANGGTFDINTRTDAVAGVQLASGSITGTTGVLTSTSAYDMQSGTVSAILAGAVGLNKTTAGTVTLSGSNTYTGATTVSAGTLVAASNTALGTAAGTTTVAAGAELQISGAGLAIAEPLNLNGAGVAGGGALRNLANANSATGAITLGSASRINSDAGTLTLSGAGNITGAGQSLTVGGAGNTTISKVIATTTGTLTKDGAGTLTLSGANTYTGLTTVSAGTLAVTVNNALGTNAAGTTVAAGATLDLQNVNYSTTEAVTLNGGTLATSTGTSSLAGTVPLTANSIVNVGGTQLTLSGVVSGAGFGIDKQGAGTLVLSGANTYTGATNISAGTLALGSANERISDLSAVTVAAGATFDLRQFSETIGSLAGAGTVTAGITPDTLTVGGDNTSTTFSGVIQNTAGILHLIKQVRERSRSREQTPTTARPRSMRARWRWARTMCWPTPRAWW